MSFFDDFVGGSAAAVADIASDRIKSNLGEEKAKSLADYQALLDAQKARTLKEIDLEFGSKKLKLEQSSEYLQAEADTNTKREKLAIAGKRGLIGSMAQLETEKYDAGADLRKKTADDAITSYRAKSQVELETEIKKMNDPQWLAGKAKVERAGDTGGALRKVQLEAAQMALSEKQAEAKMPPALKGQIAYLEKEAFDKSRSVNDVTAKLMEGEKLPAGTLAIAKERDAISKRISELRAPYMGDKVKAETIADPFPVGTVKMGLKYLGGDTSKEKNWAPVTNDKPKDKGGAVPTPAPAPQKEDTARYTRSQGRGGYSYESNQRLGKTKAEWARLDQQKK